MIEKFAIHGKASLVLQAGFIYAWLSVLSPLSVTDTYYSVYLLCAVAGLLCLYADYIGKDIDRGCGIHDLLALRAASAIFSGAVLLANYELFAPLAVLQNLYDMVCAFIGGFCIAFHILRIMLRRFPVDTMVLDRCHPLGVFLLSFLSIAMIDLLYLIFVLFPGVLTTDSFSTIAQIMGDQAYNNVMPFWHTVTVELFVEAGLRFFGDMNAAVALFHVGQILFVAACMGYVIMTLYQIGAPKLVIAAVYALYAFMPYNIVYSVTLWKDIPFAGAAVLFVTALYRILKSVGSKPKMDLCVFTAGALGFSLWRTNGWYAFLVTVMTMFFLLRKSHKKLLIIMTVVLVLCWLLIGPVLDMVGVEGTNFVEAFAVPMQQVARVVANGRELTPEQTGLLAEIFLMDKLGSAYDPLTVDPVKFETFQYDKVDYILDNLGAYIKLYLDLGIRYFDDYLKAWVDETKGYWNGGYKFWTYTLKLGENVYGIAQSGEQNAIARIYAAWFRYIEKPVILQWTISIGLYVWGLFASFLVNALQKRKEALLAIPIMVLVLGLWMGTPVYAEFRYAYPLILTLPLILCTTFYQPKQS